MEDNKIIIILLVIIAVILAFILGSMILPSLHAQKDTKLTITGNDTLHEGDNLTVKLTDLNKTPVENGIVNVTVSDKDGKVVAEESLKTNSKGKAKMNLDLGPGNYSVNATFGGNDNFTGNSTSKNITVEEVVPEPVVEQAPAQESSSSSGSGSSSDDELRPAVDSTGITREEADKYGWRYTTEHGGHYRGYHDHWDEKAGIYHD